MKLGLSKSNFIVVLRMENIVDSAEILSLIESFTGIFLAFNFIELAVEVSCVVVDVRDTFLAFVIVFVAIVAVDVEDWAALTYGLSASCSANFISLYASVY